jgi:Predicted glycosyl transferase
VAPGLPGGLTMPERTKPERAMPGRVMLYVQHLLGIGHLKRASLIADAMVDAGLNVAVVLGGPDVPGVDFERCARVNLPPVRAADETFKVLLDEDGRPIDDAWRERRVARLLTEFDALRPDVLILEMFPFGRQQFRFELLPVLERARVAEPRPKIVSSVRDALVRKADAARNLRSIRLVESWFDTVLVHGDPQLYPLTATFPEAEAIADKLVYTGYVVETTQTWSGTVAKESTPKESSAEVIVSAGGGAVGEPLLRTAIAARPLTTAATRVWRLITGPNLSTAVFDDLRWNAPPGVIVERWRDDLPRLLREAALSISQGGYNTVMDILQAGVRAVVVPFATGSETEQTFRARALADRGVLTLLEAERLTPDTLAAAVDAALARTPSVPAVDTSGAATTARLVADLCRHPAPAG